MNKKVNNFVKTLGNISLEVYNQLGGLNFDEKDFQIALGYELSKKKIDYLRETHIELFYKNVPIKLGAPDFFLNSWFHLEFLSSLKISKSFKIW